MKDQSHSPEAGPAAPWVLPLFLAITFGSACLLGPLIAVALGEGLVPFHRAMNRGLLLGAGLGLLVFRRRLDWHAWWPRRKIAWNLLSGLFVAFVSLQALLGLDLIAAGFHWAELTGKTVGRVVATALVAGVIASLIEETLFRGFVQGELRRVFPGWLAVLVGAIIYTLAHFIKIPVELDRGPVHLGSGFLAIGQALAPLGRGEFISWRGANLFLLGVVLGGLAWRHGHLWLNAGLHGGWIVGLQLFAGLTRPDVPPSIPWLAGDLLSTPLTALVICGTGLWLFYLPWGKPPNPGSSVG